MNVHVLVIAAILVGATAMNTAFAADPKVTYAYDPLGRLASATYTDANGVITATYVFTYDAAGNRLTQVVTKP